MTGKLTSSTARAVGFGLLALMVVGFVLLTHKTQAATFAVGDRVYVTAKLSVRSTPNGTKLGSQNVYALGTITSAPTTAGGYAWQQVNYDTAPDGWSANSYLKIAPPQLQVSCTSSVTAAAVNTSVKRTAVVSGGTGSNTYRWSGTNSLSGNASSVTKSYSTTGTKTATVQVTSGPYTVTANCPDVVISTTAPTTPAPTVSLSASPNPVAYNAASSLSWSSTNATSCTASGGWTGSKALSGSESTANLTATTTYTIACTGAGGTTNKSVSVGVTPQAGPPPPAPTVTVLVRPNTIEYNGSHQLSWGSTNATSCVASGAWAGSKSTTGEIMIYNNTENKVYTLTCTGPGGTGVGSGTLTVGTTTATTTPQTQTGTNLSSFIWDESFINAQLDPARLTQVFTADMDPGTSLSGPVLFAPIHAPYGGGTFDVPGTDAYQFTQVTDETGTANVLRIRAYKDANGGWHSGNVQTVNAAQNAMTQIIGGGTGFACRNCYSEARMKFPTTSVGTWAAFWLLSPDDPQVGHTEIDAIEWYGSDPKGHHHAIHIWPKSPLSHTMKSDYTGMLGVLNDGKWHTYGVLQTDEMIYIYMDRKEVARIPSAPEFKRPMYLVVTQAIYAGEASTAVPPMDIYVDYMRAYTVAGNANTQVLAKSNSLPATFYSALASAYAALQQLLAALTK